MKTKQYQMPMTEALLFETAWACLTPPSVLDNQGSAIVNGDNPDPSSAPSGPQGNAPLRF